MQKFRSFIHCLHGIFKNRSGNSWVLPSIYIPYFYIYYVIPPVVNRGGDNTNKGGLFIPSAKILLLPPKYEIIMLPSNQSFFQYCDSNIGLLSIGPCKVITLNPLCILFGISSLLLFLWLLFLSYRSFSFLKGIAIRLPLIFANAFKSLKKR